MTDTLTLLPADAEPYVAAVRSMLWALPADERDELLDDLSAHLAELAAEEGPSLRERLGPPAQYAAEFVTSAGVESPLSQAPISLPRVRQWLRMPPSIRARVAALRPAWLVLRPFLVALAAMQLVDKQFLRQEDFANVAELVVVAIAGSLGVKVSQRIADTGGWSDRSATLAGVVSVVIIVSALSAGSIYVNMGSDDYAPSGVLMRGDGTPVTNIWAYDADGNPIDVFLFDQDGRPIDDVMQSGWDRQTGDELRSPMRTDANGAGVANLFPREMTRVDYDEYGRPVERDVRPPAYSTPRLESERSTTTRAPAESSTTTSAPPLTSTTVRAAP